uniref:energy transducer TonB n=1 Tax=Nitratifractor sp. TaxID=2268144 RepID=UPI0025EDC3E9
VTPKAVNKTRISLDLTQFQTLPPKAPTRPPHPKPIPKPKQLRKAVPKAQQMKIAKGMEHQNLLPVDSNMSQRKKKREKPKKIVIKTVEKKELKKPKKSSQKVRRKVAKRTHRKAEPPRRSKAAPPRHARRRSIPRHAPTGPASRLIKRLYGSSYSRMSSAQRKFIDENLRRILRISQQTLNYLGYPREAARFGEQGTNIVQFYLHPNGDISGLRLRRRTGSSSLDRQTIEVIKTAYMHYPRPRTTTKIIIYVRYRLY